MRKALEPAARNMKVGSLPPKKKVPVNDCLKGSAETGSKQENFEIQTMNRICVIDGQGGGIGSTVIKKIKDTYEESIEIIALGTNAIATAQMLKSRANRGASGENAIVQTVKNVDIIIGPIGIIMAHSMMGEVTPKMAEAVAASPARKLLIPLSQERIVIIGAAAIPLPKLVEELIGKHLTHLIDIIEESTHV